MAAMRMLGQTPTSLTETFEGLDVEAEIAKRAKSAQLPAGQTWNKIRQAQAMLTYNITAQFDNDLVKTAKAINEKLLIIVSKGDRVVSPGPATALAKLSNATLLELDKGCGHADPWCDAETFSNALREFLAE
ncbi:MAG: alpha/beta hydrolase [Gammaproteobacteria bacterium]|nr:alpha/beta hydrolase [Gammaproteobacteria bacterium]